MDYWVESNIGFGFQFSLWSVNLCLSRHHVIEWIALRGGGWGRSRHGVGEAVSFSVVGIRMARRFSHDCAKWWLELQALFRFWLLIETLRIDSECRVDERFAEESEVRRSIAVVTCTCTLMFRVSVRKVGEDEGRLEAILENLKGKLEAGVEWFGYVSSRL